MASELELDIRTDRDLANQVYISQQDLGYVKISRDKFNFRTNDFAMIQWWRKTVDQGEGRRKER